MDLHGPVIKGHGACLVWYKSLIKYEFPTAVAHKLSGARLLILKRRYSRIRAQRPQRIRFLALDSSLWHGYARTRAKRPLPAYGLYGVSRSLLMGSQGPQGICLKGQRGF